MERMRENFKVFLITRDIFFSVFMIPDIVQKTPFFKLWIPDNMIVLSVVCIKETACNFK